VSLKLDPSAGGKTTMSIFDRLFGTKKAPPTAEPTQQPAVPAERSRPQSTSNTAQPSQPDAIQSATQAPPPNTDATKFKIKQTLDAARQRHQVPDLADMVGVLVAVESLTNYSTVVEIGLCAAAEHRACYIGDLKSQYMKCWWHWYEHPTDPRRRADSVIVVTAYPEQYYGELGRHLVNHCHFWLTEGAPDRSDNLKRHFGDIPSREQIAEYQAAETAQKPAKAAGSTNDKYEPRARISKQDPPIQKPVTSSTPTQGQAIQNAPSEPSANPQTTRLTISRDFPPEITKGHSREQVAELIRASARFTWTGIGNWIGETFSDPSTSGVNDPAAASVTFQMTISASEEQSAIKAVQRNWEFLIDSVRKHGGLGGFCEEYRKVTSTRAQFNPHKPICDKCARDLNPSPLFRAGDHYSGYICNPCKKVLCPRCAAEYSCPYCGTKLNDAGLKGLLDLANARQAVAQGATLIEALAVVISPTTGERAEAIEWFDAIASSTSFPLCSFDLVVAEGPKIYMTAVICFFDSSNGTPKPEGSIHDNFLPWLKAAAGDRTWYTQEAYGPQTYPPGTILKLEGYFGGIQILRHKRIEAKRE
jgi:hypothetical protein